MGNNEISGPTTASSENETPIAETNPAIESTTDNKDTAAVSESAAQLGATAESIAKVEEIGDNNIIETDHRVPEQSEAVTEKEEGKVIQMNAGERLIHELESAMSEESGKQDPALLQAFKKNLAEQNISESLESIQRKKDAAAERETKYKEFISGLDKTLRNIRIEVDTCLNTIPALSPSSEISDMKKELRRSFQFLGMTIQSLKDIDQYPDPNEAGAAPENMFDQVTKDVLNFPTSIKNDNIAKIDFMNKAIETATDNLATFMAENPKVPGSFGMWIISCYTSLIEASCFLQWEKRRIGDNKIK